MPTTSTVTVDAARYARLYTDAVEAAQAAVEYRRQLKTCEEERKAAPVTPEEVGGSFLGDNGVTILLGMGLVLALLGLGAASGKVLTRDE